MVVLWTEPGPKARRAVKLAAHIALREGSLSRTEFHSKVIPYCDAPVLVVATRRSSSKAHGIEATMRAPCRKCAKCLLFRQMKWRERALAELGATHAAMRRSWWVTLTFDPVTLAGVLAKATLAARGDYDARVDRAAFALVQRYFKRLRKAGCKFRYMCVFERGEKTGRPHYHIFLHEMGPKPILYAQIVDQWHSHAHAKLVCMDGKGHGLASYLTKYATKSAATRIRASQGYGKRPAA